MKKIFILFLFLQSLSGHSQYIGVKAKYTDTRLVPNPGHADTREDRMVLCFYNVDPAGVWTPISMSNYDMYVHTDGVQVAGISGVLDSIGSNYPGYNFTAPVVAAYYNSMGREWVDCVIGVANHYVVNGHELDCGFLKVSEWSTNYLDNEEEHFTTIDVHLPYYFWPDPLAMLPGNVNFGPYGTLGNPPYNLYNFACGTLQVVNRGQMWADSTGNSVPLPIHFANIEATVDQSCRATINWSNLTESDINYYRLERSIGNGTFEFIDSVPPSANNGGRADYSFVDTAVISGFNLYRIKAVENSGNFFYSMVLRINGCRGGRTDANAPRLRIYPNPAQGGRFVLNATDLPKGKYDIIFVSLTGHQQKITELDHDGGTVNKLFDLGWITPGMYSLILRSADLNLSQKIIITN